MCVVTFDWEKNDAIEKFKNFDRKKSVSWVVVEITDSCNFNCKWCFANSMRGKGKSHMKMEDMKRLLRYLSDNGVKQVTFSGGEPTVYPYLKDAIGTAKGLGMVVHMNTNGFLLSKEKAKELHSLGLSQVQINIDSLRSEKHDEVRGMKGSHGKAIEALKNAVGAGITCVSQTVITKENEGEIADIFRFSRSMGIQRCRVWDMTPSEGRAIENENMISNNYLGTLQKLSDFAYSTGAKQVEAGEPLFMPNVTTDLKISGGYCVAAAGLYMTISKSGDVYLCATLRKPLYNIFDRMKEHGDLSEFHKEKARLFVESFKTSESCKECKFIEKCKGGCYTRRKYSQANEDYLCIFRQNT
jgi:radical SAM protein with 4Fe4S-binding SPASM domain